MKPFPWAEAMQFGFGVLHLSSDAFWKMTPRELAQAIIAVRGRGPAGIERGDFDVADEAVSGWFVIPGCALLGADPESSTVHCSGFRVRSLCSRPGMTEDKTMADSTDLLSTSSTLDSLSLKTKDLTASAGGFARAMTQAFSASVTGGKQFDDVLKSLGLRISDLAVRLAFKPLEKSLTSGISGLLSGLTGSAGGSASSSLTAASGAIKPFAAGGVIGTPTYFPLVGGGVGLAGEAGPEAIMPLTRGRDGRLGVAGGGGNTINVQIATPDLDNFRRSESYITGQIARAVARGQRSL